MGNLGDGKGNGEEVDGEGRKVKRVIGRGGSRATGKR